MYKNHFYQNIPLLKRFDKFIWKYNSILFFFKYIKNRNITYTWFSYTINNCKNRHKIFNRPLKFINFYIFRYLSFISISINFDEIFNCIHITDINLWNMSFNFLFIKSSHKKVKNKKRFTIFFNFSKVFLQIV